MQRVPYRRNEMVKIVKIVKNMAVLGLLIMALFAMVTPVQSRLAPEGDQYDRTAMVKEAEYAMRGSYAGPFYSGQTGMWNYMESDIEAQKIVVGRFGSIYAGSTTQIVNGKVPNGWGKGGQCLFFVNLILYRSNSDRTTNQINWNSIEAKNAPIEQVKAGDIIFKPRPSPHIIIVDSRSGDNIWVIDSNYGLNEAMKIRYTNIPTLKSQGYKIYTGVDYYYK